MNVDLGRLHEYQIVSTDTETTGLHWYRDRMFGVAVAVSDGKTVASQYFDIREQPRVIEVLKKQLPRVKRLVNHNMKFDAHFLLNEGIQVPMHALECTSVRAALINEHERSFSLDALGDKYCGIRKVDIWADLAKLFGGAATKAVQIKNLHRAPASLAGKYATQDPIIAIKLWLWQQEEIEDQKLQQVWDLERRLMPVLIDIERHGVRVDEQRAHDGLKQVYKDVAKAQRALNKVAGKEVNANSPPQVKELFKVKKDKNDKWHTDSGFLLETTDAGNASIGKDVLRVMAEQGDTRARDILTIRRMLKASQFLKDHIIGHAVNGRVYPNYNQTRGDNELGTGTGRFSIDDPALQQIPKRDKDVAAITRSCFIPEKGHDWGCADWEQFEFRWFAHYTKDPRILKVFADNPDADFHQIVADITGIPRNAQYAGAANAKQINLGLVFGMGQGTMAYEMGLDYELVQGRDGKEWRQAGEKAIALFEKYHSAIPGVEALLKQASSVARTSRLCYY